MIRQNRSLDNSLRCMQHPLTLLSIALLLLNDHVFKVIAPSWLTGKLSDFAGLFFFPFLVVAALSLLPGSRRLSPNALGAVASGLVGSWFFLFKTYPPVYAASTTAISALVGHRVVLVRDWTDVLALIVLWPAWRLWRRPRQDHRHHLAYISLTLGVVACLATSPAIQPLHVEGVYDLIYYKGMLFALDSHQQPSLIASSQDMGIHWETQYEEGLIDEIKTQVTSRTFPVVACDPENTTSCYRIEMGSKVESSTDGGESWQTAWEIPSERIAFVERRAKPTLDVRTYDLLIINENDKSVLFVALGNEGVLKRELPNGAWERIGVGDAQPTPYKASTLGDAIGVIWRELAMMITISLLALFVAGLVGWKSFHRTELGVLDWTDWCSLVVLIIGLCLVVSLAAAVPLWVLTDSHDQAYPAMVAFFFYPLLFEGLWYSSRKWTRKITENTASQTKLTVIYFTIAAAICIVSSLPWLLWAYGVIANYNHAMILALILALLIFVGGYYLIYRRGRGSRPSAES